jgi:hypothetical protein
MSWRGLVCGAIFLGGFGFCSGGVVGGSDQSGDADNANPYAVINARNPFRMNPPLPPVDPNAAPAPELPKVIFSGTMVNAGQRKAMFAVESKEPKDPKVKPAAAAPQETTTYMCLAEGDTSGPVQLLKIMKGGDEVEIMNSGTRMTLNMKENGFGTDKAPAGKGGGPAAVIHNSGANPNFPPPTMPGQPAAQPGGNGGIISGGAGGDSYRGGFNAAGVNAANPGGGTLSGGAPVNRAGLSSSTSFGGNTGGIMSGGATVAANPVTSTAPNGLNAFSISSGGLGSQSSMTPNNSPMSTTPLRNVVPPPTLPTSGQQQQQKE